MSARERFFKKVKQNNDAIPHGKKSVEELIRTFCQRMDELSRQVYQWFDGSPIEVTCELKHLHDLSTIGYSLSSGICRYEIITIYLQNKGRSVSIIPEQLCRGEESGYVKMNVNVPGLAACSQTFFLSMAPETGWFIRRDNQSVRERVIMTEDQFFQAVEKLA